MGTTITAERQRQLEFDRQAAILSRLVPIGDEIESLSKKLIEGGFTSFCPYRDFQASFCECGDIPEHERYLREEAKLWLGSPNGLPGHYAGLEQGYTSAIITEMRRNRDLRNGCSYAELKGDEVWKREIDPCLRELARLEAEGSSIPTTRRRALRTEGNRLKSEEILRHALEVDSNPEHSPCEYAERFSDYLDQSFAPLGFHRDEFRSSPFFPVLSKPLTRSWDLCWSAENDQNLRLLPRFSFAEMPPSTPIDLRLYVRAAGTRGPAMVPLFFKASDVMIIRYHQLIVGFSSAYGRFANPAEMLVVVKAHARLYSFISDFVEAVLSVELAKG